MEPRTDEDNFIMYELTTEYESDAFIYPLIMEAACHENFTMSWKDLKHRIKEMRLISQEKYNQVKARNRRRGVNISEEWTIRNSNFYEIVDVLTNHKLPIDEIFEAQDFLDEILRGREIQVSISVDKRDAGRLLVGVMDNMEYFSRLSMEEKRWFACAVIVMTYVGRYDDKRGDFLLGIFDFTSVADFRSKYNCGYGWSFFETADNFPKYDNRQPFGYSMQNPITTATVRFSALYLKALKSKDGAVSIRRLGTVKGTFGELLDKYEVTVTKKRFFGKDEKVVNYLYVNEFGLKNSIEPPQGFVLQPN